ncbi:MAG: phage protein Gp37 [Syntrophobacteraceae bacterium]
MATLSEIEDAIIAKLKADLLYLKKVGTLSDLLESTADKLSTIVPCAFVSYSGGSYSSPCMNTTTYDRDMEFSILIVSRNVVSQKKLLHGTVVKKGIYQIMEDIVQTLKGQTLGLVIRPLEPVSEQAVDGDSITAIYGITFGTKSRT